MKQYWLRFFKGVGGLEIMVALFPIVAGYSNWGMIWSILMIIVALIRRNGSKMHFSDRYISLCFLYVIIHEIIVLLINGLETTMFHHLIATSLYLLAVIIVPYSIKYENLIPSLYLIAIIASIGLIFQFAEILAGRMVTPIALPFLPKPDLDSRLWAELGRPSSFFWEPASFVTYMMIPLFITLIKKHIPLSFFFFFCIILSTSSNGIFLAPVMIIVYILTSKAKKTNKFLITVALAGMAMFFLQSDLFDIGKDKIENTEFSENVRIANGPTLVSRMPAIDLIFGITETTVEKYLVKNPTGLSLSHMDSFFLSDFWYVMVVYGIIGLIFHLLVYFHLIKIEKSLMPYIAVLLIAHFTQSISFRSMYVYQMIFIWAYVMYNKKNRNSHV